MKSKFNWRSFISFGLTWSLLIIFVSGIVLYISPAGRYANWVNWKVAGFTKEGWAAIHAVFSYTFVVLSIFHLFTVNWTAFWSYLKSKTKAGINKKKELAISTVLTLVFFLGIIYAVPPFRYVEDFGEFIAGTWEKNEQVTSAAPVAHAELLTINELAYQLKIGNTEEFSRKFTANGIMFDNTDKQSLQEIAKQNNTTPAEIYQKVTKKSGNEKPGAGMGRKTVENLAEESGTTVEELIKLLSTHNIVAEKGQTIRQVGDNNNISPKEIMDLLKK
jgi:hypothetical protein